MKVYLTLHNTTAGCPPHLHSGLPRNEGTLRPEDGSLSASGAMHERHRSRRTRSSGILADRECHGEAGDRQGSRRFPPSLRKASRARRPCGGLESAIPPDPTIQDAIQADGLWPYDSRHQSSICILASTGPLGALRQCGHGAQGPLQETLRRSVAA